MATLTISLSDEEMRLLEALGKREGLNRRADGAPRASTTSLANLMTRSMPLPSVG